MLEKCRSPKTGEMSPHQPLQMQMTGGELTLALGSF